MKRISLVGLALLVSVLATGVIGGCAATPKLVQQKRDETTIVFRPSGKGLKEDVEKIIGGYLNSCEMPNNPEDQYGNSRKNQVDTLQFQQYVNDALKELKKYGDNCVIYIHAQPSRQ
jgi:hypothetical protein